MDSVDNEDKIRLLFKYGKWVLLGVLIILIFFIVRGCGTNYGEIENQMIEEAKRYVSEKGLVITDETYIEIINFDSIDGTELCNKSSGVIVTSNNGSLKYQAYLKCPNYVSKILNNKSKYIKLNGDEVTFLNSGELFKDEHYTIIGELINGYVDIRGSVSQTPGIYTIYYDVYYPSASSEDAEHVENYDLVETLVRKVIVTKSDKNTTISGLVNTEEPYLELLGESNIVLAKGEKYVEPGYKAVDYTDGKITRQVVVVGEVNTKKVDTYTLVYSITNSKGKVTVKKRTVDVVSKKGDFQINVNKEEKNNTMMVTVTVVGEGFNYMYGINSERVNGRTYTFTATENKPYQITVIDMYGNRISKEIGISEIDDVKPFGTCKAVTMYGKTTMTVDASDNKGIAGYIYKTDTKTSEFLTSSSYEASEKTNSAKVIIRDISGNETEITCELEEGSKFYVNEKGYNCLYPYTCFKQGDYSNWHYSFCSTDTCGKISQRGCSITSVTTVVSGFGVKDKNGELYTPYTMLSEVYDPVACKYKKYCSGSTTSYRAFTHLGLTITPNEKGGNAYYFSRDQIPTIINHLKKGGAVLIRVAGPGMYAVGKGHIMALLGVNEKDEVYLFDPNAKYGETNGKGPVNTFISTEYLVKGKVTWFQLVSKK